MANEGVTIPIRTTADTSGEKAASASLKNLQKELKETAAATRDLNAASSQGVDDLKKVGDSATKAAGNKGSSGMGMLQLGQALEDAQYGLRGVMNNIPGLVTSFGLGAGAAGVLQVGLVAVSQVLDLIQRQNKELEGKPLLGEMTFDEKIMEQSRLFTEELARQRDVLRERNDALRDSAAAVDTAMKAEQALIEFRRSVEDADFVSTGDPIMDAVTRKDTALQRSFDDRTSRNKGRAAEVVNVRSEQSAREADLAALDKQLAEQKALVDGVKQRAALESALALAKDPNMKAPGGVAAGDGSLAESLTAGVLNSIPGLKELLGGRKTIDGATIAGLQKRMEGLPMLPGFQPSGNAEEDDKRRRDLYNEELQRQRDLEKAREDAARGVESGRRKVGLTEQKVASEDELDTEKTAREQELIRRRAEAAIAQEEKRRQMEAEKNAPPAPVAPSEIEAAQKGLRNMAGQPGASDTTKGALGALNAAISDGQGNTGAEVQIVQQMLSKMGSDRAQNAALMQQALREMESVQTEGSLMQQKLAGALSVIVSAYRTMRNDLDSVVNEVNAINANRPR